MAPLNGLWVLRGSPLWWGLLWGIQGEAGIPETDLGVRKPRGLLWIGRAREAPRVSGKEAAGDSVGRPPGASRADELTSVSEQPVRACEVPGSSGAERKYGDDEGLSPGTRGA